jgi:hypothetical protein
MGVLKIGLGWVPLDAEGNPYKAPQIQKRDTVVLFPTESEAKNNSPVKKAKPVFYEEKVLDK